MDDFKDVDVDSLHYRLANSFFGAFISSTVLTLMFGTWWAVAANSWTAFFTIYGTLFSLAFLYGAGKGYLEYIHLKYKLSAQSVGFRSGMLSVNTTIPYSKITNASYSQSFFARMFSVGNINIDQEDSSFSFEGIGSRIADEVLDEISKKSNIHPTH